MPTQLQNGQDGWQTAAVICDTAALLPVENHAVRGGTGSVIGRPIPLDASPGSALAAAGVNRLAPGASIGLHAHAGDEDIYFCLSGSGIVTDNGVEHPFQPGVFQITRSGETQALRNTGAGELVFLGLLLRVRADA